MRQIDVVSAYLNAPLDEKIWMNEPAGFVDKEAPTASCRLLHALYGLKQAGRAWNKRFDSFLRTELHFTRCSSDPCVYHKNQGTRIIILALSVDDQFIIHNDDK